MSNDTGRTPEDDLIYQHLVKLVKLIERTGRKVTGLRIEFERSPEQRFELIPGDSEISGQPTEPFKSDKFIAVLPEEPQEESTGGEMAEMAAYLRAGPVFVLKPVDDQVSIMDDFSDLHQDDETRH